MIDGYENIGLHRFDVTLLEDINTPIYNLKRSQLVQLCTDVFEVLGLVDYLQVESSMV